MTQTTNRFLDELAKLMTDAAGAAQGMRREVETLMKAQGERILRDMDVVQREEFEAVKEMAAKAREENERLAARIAALEAELAALRGQSLSRARPGRSCFPQAVRSSIPNFRRVRLRRRSAILAVDNRAPRLATRVGMSDYVRIADEAGHAAGHRRMHGTQRQACECNEHRGTEWRLPK